MPPFLVVAAILLLGVNLRGPIIAVSPVLDTIAADLRIGAATAGLLTSLPVLCFGAGHPGGLGAAGPRRARPRGVDLAGRAAGGHRGAVGRRAPSALAGTLLIGVAITVGNIAVPVVIARDLPRRAGPVLGGYTAALNVGSMITLALTVPLAAALGWRTALVAVVGRAGGGGAWRSAVYATRRTDPRDDARPRRAGPPTTTADAGTTAPGGAARSSGASRPRSPARPSPTTASRRGCRCCCATSSGWPPPAPAPSASIFQVAALVGAFGVPVLLRVLPGSARGGAGRHRRVGDPAARPPARPASCGRSGARSAARRRAAASW